eukprot:CAMPEP_0184312006 /NCGR_PEP_ID=MMETSP1049-20130417/46228_1 /TAXON_ID=77928 /ORGANISM="Proteomonas sulcata, Strain CCMP704" /LENGTH=76 /DNA_ID=CAMNT_0026627829 /DNA_START=61 /DNA_END=291 /DNA_ORIENTATION=-
MDDSNHGMGSIRPAEVASGYSSGYIQPSISKKAQQKEQQQIAAGYTFAQGQTRETFGGTYGPETYNVGDQWGGRQE